MSRDVNTVLLGLLKISPPGASLPADPDSGWGMTLLPLASEISRCEAQAESMLPEVDPRNAFYLLPDFEAMLGPDPYGRDIAGLSNAQRQLIAYQRLTGRGGQSPQYFIDMAASLGVTISITEQRPAIYGRARYGDRYLISPEQFVWLVTMPQTQVEKAVYGSAVYGDRYGQFEPNSVQNVIEAQAPDHTLPVFSYTG